MFGHERLDSYKVSLQYLKWGYEIEERLKGKHRHAKDKLLRVSQSIPLNIVEVLYMVQRFSTIIRNVLQDNMDGSKINKKINGKIK